MYRKRTACDHSFSFIVVFILLTSLLNPFVKTIADGIVNPPEETLSSHLEEITPSKEELELMIENYLDEKYQELQLFVAKFDAWKEYEEEQINQLLHHENIAEAIPTETVEETVPETTAAYFPEETREPESTSVLKRGSNYVPEYEYGRQPDIPIDIPAPLSDTDMRNYIGYVNTSEYLYLGTYRITGYTPGCSHCCGNSNGITTSGNKAQVGFTVAAERNLPLGVTLYIEGFGFYVVQDRGNLQKNTIDIAAPTHDACYSITRRNGLNVYVVPLDQTTINTEYDDENIELGGQ